jgi:hypothetical protein
MAKGATLTEAATVLRNAIVAKGNTAVKYRDHAIETRIQNAKPKQTLPLIPLSLRRSDRVLLPIIPTKRHPKKPELAIAAVFLITLSMVDDRRVFTQRCQATRRRPCTYQTLHNIGNLGLYSNRPHA